MPSVKMKIGPHFVVNLAQWGIKTNVLSKTKSVPLCLKWNFLPEPFSSLIIYNSPSTRIIMVLGLL